MYRHVICCANKSLQKAPALTKEAGAFCCCPFCLYHIFLSICVRYIFHPSPFAKNSNRLLRAVSKKFSAEGCDLPKKFPRTKWNCSKTEYPSAEEIRRRQDAGNGRAAQPGGAIPAEERLLPYGGNLLEKRRMYCVRCHNKQRLRTDKACEDSLPGGTPDTSLQKAFCLRKELYISCEREFYAID